MTRKIPHHTMMFLYRQGLKIKPSDNFTEKFIEFYNEFLYKNKARKHIPPLDTKTATFFINSIIEAVIYCLDFGYDVWFRHVLLFFQRISDYRHNVKSHTVKVVENVKKISIRPIKSMVTRMKKTVNLDNEEFQEFLADKQQRFDNIKRYYREFYAKENQWWKGLPD